MECLVTRLKGTVNDASLEKFGYVKLHIDEGAEGDIGHYQIVPNLEAVTYTAIMENATEGCNFVTNQGTVIGKEVVVTRPYGNIYVNSGSCDIFIPKYNSISEFVIRNTNSPRISINLDDLGYAEFSYFVLGGDNGGCYAKNIKGNIDNLNFVSGMKTIVCNGKESAPFDVTGDLSEIIKTHTLLTTVSFIGTNVEFDFSILENYGHSMTKFIPPLNCTNKDIKYYGYLNLNSIVATGRPATFYGTLEEMVQIRANAYGAGALVMNPGYFRNVTYNGSSLSLFGNSQRRLVWDAQGNITSFDAS